MPSPVYLLLIAALACVIVLAMLVPLLRSGLPGVRSALWANAAVVTGLLAFLLQQRNAPVWLSILIPNALVALGVSLYYASVRLLLGRRVPVARLAGAAAALLLVLGYYSYVDWSLATRMVAASIYLLGMMLCVAHAVWSGRGAGRLRYSHLFTLVVTLVLGASYGLRIWVYGTDSEGAVAMLAPSTWNVVFLSLSVLLGPGMLLGLVMMFQDRVLDEREREASLDFLTGALSRKAWWAETERLGALAHRQGGPLMLLLLDIDRFKRINDTHGHAGGDAVLRHFRELATGVLRKFDVLGRLGGEEFAVALPGTKPEEARVSAERLRRSVAESSCRYDGRDIRYTFSAGLAAWEAGESLQAAVSRADRALYAAKQGGRNRVAAGDGEALAQEPGPEPEPA